VDVIGEVEAVPGVLDPVEDYAPGCGHVSRRAVVDLGLVVVFLELEVATGFCGLLVSVR
jgi:hypothetical protein